MKEIKFSWELTWNTVKEGGLGKQGVLGWRDRDNSWWYRALVPPTEALVTLEGKVSGFSVKPKLIEVGGL